MFFFPILQSIRNFGCRLSFPGGFLGCCGFVEDLAGVLESWELGEDAEGECGTEGEYVDFPEAGNPDAQICEMDLSSPRVEASELDSVTVEELNVWNKR